MLETEATKTCFKCGELKTLSMFYKHPKMSDGHVNKCKECNKKDVQENYKVNIDHFRGYDKTRNKTQHRITQAQDSLIRRRDTESYKELRNIRSAAVKIKYQNDPVYRENILAIKQKWCDANTDKRLAHHAVNHAVRDGKLIKPTTCTKCGKSGCTIYGHHWSYLPEHQLDVLWLCSSCHGKEHRKL